MKIFIWERAMQVSSAYHSDGGLLVIAASEEEARQFANATPEVTVTPEEMPTLVLELADGQGEAGKVLTFPNAGCC